MAQLSENPRSRETVALVREIYGGIEESIKRTNSADGYLWIMGENMGVSIVGAVPHRNPKIEVKPAETLSLSWAAIIKRATELADMGKFAIVEETPPELPEAETPVPPEMPEQTQQTQEQDSEDLATEATEAPQELPLIAISEYVKSKLEAGEKFTSAELFAEATKAYGGTMANNVFSSKDAYDAMELGVNRHILAMENVSPENIIKMLELLPTQTKRTTEMEKYQQFSTPPSIAYFASWAANVTEDDIVLEPSAGNGGIAVFAKRDGAAVYVSLYPGHSIS